MIASLPTPEKLFALAPPPLPADYLAPKHRMRQPGQGTQPAPLAQAVQLPAAT